MPQFAVGAHHPHHVHEHGHLNEEGYAEAPDGDDETAQNLHVLHGCDGHDNIKKIRVPYIYIMFSVVFLELARKRPQL